MENENFCAFVAERESFGDVRVLYYVYETRPQPLAWRSVTFSRMHFVTEGEGVLHTPSGEFPLTAGDVFILMPGMPYMIDTAGGLKYVYVCVNGDRVRDIAEMLRVTPASCVFRNMGRLAELWKGGIGLSTEMLKFYGEGAFLTTAAVIGEELFAREESRVAGTTAASLIKREADEQFADPTLTLESVCRRLNYSPKYISSAFKREYGVTFKDYLTTTRINNSLALMDKGFVSIKDISNLSGFSDPLYFSKVFKQRMRITPTEQIAEIKRRREKVHKKN